MKENCIFCKIVSGQIPNYKVYEDENVLAFLDVHPCSKGHTVVIPKNHVQFVGDLNEQEWLKVMSGVKKVAGIVKEKLKAPGLNIGVNDGPAAGQSVPHLHWHVIPRYEKDGGGSMHSIVRSQEAGDVAETAKLFA